MSKTTARRIRRAFVRVTDLCSRAINKLENQLPTRHATIDTGPFLERIKTIVEDFVGTLETLRSEQPDVSSDDKLRNRLDTLLAGRVGRGFSKDELDRIYSEGKTRYERKFPPGFQDQSKAGTDSKSEIQTHNGLIMREKYGDLITWSQIIEEANRCKSDGVLFVTDDKKKDWWWIHEGETIGPRVELVEEIRKKAGVSLFYMYNSDSFLTYAREYIGSKIEESSIDELRATREELEIPATLAQILSCH